MELKCIKNICICLSLVFTMSACSNTTKQSEEPKYTLVGIVQISDNQDLCYATNGFEAALKEKMGEENVMFDVQYADGDAKSCSKIIDTFIEEGVSMIMANGSTPLQIAQAKTDSIPIVATSINDYGKTLEIKNGKGSTGINVTGTSDHITPIYQAEAMIELFPVKSYEKVGIVTEEETNSIKEIKEHLEEKGYDCEIYSYQDKKDFSSFIKKCDVIYLSKDKTSAANIKDIQSVVEETKMPVYTNDKSFCKKCGVATMTVNYYALGYKTGEMAYKILGEGEDISAMEIQYMPQFQKKVNLERAKELNIEIPDNYSELE